MTMRFYSSYVQRHRGWMVSALRRVKHATIAFLISPTLPKIKHCGLVGLLLLFASSCSHHAKEVAYPNSNTERKIISASPQDSVVKRLALATLIGAAVYGMELVNEVGHTSAARTGTAVAQASAKPMIGNISADLDMVLRQRARDPRQARRALIESAAFNEQVIKFVHSYEEKVQSVGVKSATTLNRVLADVGQVVCLRRQWLLYLKNSEKNQNLARSYQERIRVLENYKRRLEVLVRDSLPESV